MVPNLLKGPKIYGEGWFYHFLGPRIVLFPFHLFCHLPRHLLAHYEVPPVIRPVLVKNNTVCVVQWLLHYIMKLCIHWNVKIRFENLFSTHEPGQNPIKKCFFYLKSIVSPASEFHFAALVIEWEPCNVNRTGGFEHSWRNIGAKALACHHDICRIGWVKWFARTK